MHLPYIPKQFYKTPLAVLGYVWDWSRWLTQRGDTIASVEFLCDKTGLTFGTPVNVAGVITVPISGGVLKEKYFVTCKITTTGLGVAGVLVNTRSMVLCIVNM